MIFRPAILYVDDEKSNLKLFEKAFASEYVVKTCLSGKDALALIESEHFPLIIADQKMPSMTGIELCEKLIEVSPQSHRMILTAYSETDILLNAINRGHVQDYIVKPWRKSELKIVIDRAFDAYKLRAAKIQALEERAGQVGQLEQEIREIFDFGSLIGASAGLKSVVEVIAKAAPTDSTMMILGETGTGKELIARLIHDSSHRNKGPFVAVHCAALAKTVLESELFGHEKGAFTGADQTRVGRIESANGGTLFLDEVGEIPEEVQVKLLRVLQEREIQRVGANKTMPVDVRVVVATHRDLEEEVRAGRFRKDLFYRLNVIPLTVPALRDRTQDIEALGGYFLNKFNRQMGKDLSLSFDALEALTAYDWPGNVRELQNILERAVILSAGPEIDAEDLKLPSSIPEIVNLKNSDPTDVRALIQQEAIQKISHAMRSANGNISEAARAMGIARTTLFDRLKKYKMI